MTSPFSHVCRSLAGHDERRRAPGTTRATVSRIELSLTFAAGSSSWACLPHAMHGARRATQRRDRAWDRALHRPTRENRELCRSIAARARALSYRMTCRCPGSASFSTRGAAGTSAIRARPASGARARRPRRRPRGALDRRALPHRRRLQAACASTSSASAAATARTTSPSPASSTSTAAAALPQLAFLRGGTMNTVANSVGVSRGSPEGLLGRLMRAYAAARVAAARQRRAPRDAHRRALRLPLRHRRRLRLSRRVLRATASPPRSSPRRRSLRGIGSTLVGGEMIRRMARPFRGTVELDDGTRLGRARLPRRRRRHDRPDRPEFPPVPSLRRARRTRSTCSASTPRRWASCASSRASGAPSRCAPAAPTRRPPRARSSGAPTGTMRYMIDGDLHEQARRRSRSDRPAREDRRRHLSTLG